jgi:hypothetical protein
MSRSLGILQKTKAALLQPGDPRGYLSPLEIMTIVSAIEASALQADLDKLTKIVQDLGGSEISAETKESILSKLGAIRLTGSNTGDQDLSGLELKGVAATLINTAIAGLRGGNINDTFYSLRTMITALQAVDTTVSQQMADIMFLLDSDVPALDTLREIVAYIQANRQSLNEVLLNKVDKVDGMGLSANNFTTEEKNKLADIIGLPADYFIDQDGEAVINPAYMIKQHISLVDHEQPVVDGVTQDFQIRRSWLRQFFLDMVEELGLGTADPEPAKPAAPKNIIVDDVNNTMAFTNTGGKSTLDTEKTFNGGASVVVNTENPIQVGDFAFASVPTPQVGVRYKATSESEASEWAWQNAPFTSAGGDPAADNHSPLMEFDIDSGNATMQDSNSQVATNQASTKSRKYIPAGAAFSVRYDASITTDGGLLGISDGNNYEAQGGRLGAISWKRGSNGNGRWQGTIANNGYYDDFHDFTVTPICQFYSGLNEAIIHHEVSYDGGATFVEFPSGVIINRPAGNLYVKTFFFEAGSIKNIRHIGMVSA